ncbi:NAM domain-containing protein [Cephalotus follicularis]|uniref:NAM domain-containing protein n=1 Tax=Cephalotus follicularis TaxID=3775 RepID=A0A1Q3DBZ7_CEPFO|nr:NAM domain-containing protein [Cephalotus follicularis]
MATLPRGYKFRPSDNVLVLHFLFNKVYNRPFQSSFPPPIMEFDSYQDVQLWKTLYEESRKEDELFFFTQLKNIHSYHLSPITCGWGIWKPIKDDYVFQYPGGDISNKIVIGSKRCFSFEPAEDFDLVTNETWVLSEYRLDGVVLDSKYCANKNHKHRYVVCRVKKDVPDEFGSIPSDHSSYHTSDDEDSDSEEETSAAAPLP